MLLQFYMKTGNCKFGATCKFHHPKDIKLLQTTQDDGDGELKDSLYRMGAITGNGKNVQPLVTFSPAQLHNSKGLPIRPVSNKFTGKIGTNSPLLLP